MPNARPRACAASCRPARSSASPWREGTATARPPTRWRRASWRRPASPGRRRNAVLEPRPSALPPQGYELLDRRGILAVHGVPQVPILLQAKPEVRRHPENSRQSKRGVERDRSFSPNDLVEPRKGDSEADCKRRLTDPERFQELLQQHFPRMRRRQMTREAALAESGSPLSAGLRALGSSGNP